MWGRTLTNRETTEGGTSRWRKLIEARGRLDLSLLSLFGLVGAEKRKERLQCGAARSKQRGDELGAVGCLYTLGPVLNAGGVMQES